MRPKKPARRPVWLTPEAAAAAGRLTHITGLSLEELVELALMGVDADELGRDLGVATPAPPAPRPSAQIIPIGRGRRPADTAERDLHRPPARAPLADEWTALRCRTEALRARAEDARRHSVAAREKASALLRRDA